MSKVEFKPAQRENVGLWINLVGGTGSGKTMSAMRLAAGISNGKPFAVIDTENRHALHYADRFNFHHAELRAPFRPDSYADAVVAADEAGYPVIVVDSGSHVWGGDGGMLDWQEEELNAMVERGKRNKDTRSEWQIREAGKMSAWIKPKHAHKQMVSKFLQVKAHIILCLRAEQKIEMIKGPDGKTKIQAKSSLVGLDGWIPICDKNLPFEATCSFLLTADKPGLPQPIKLQEQHRDIFRKDAPIDEEAGKRLAAWAAGGEAVKPTKSKAEKKPVEKFDEKPTSKKAGQTNVEKCRETTTLLAGSDAELRNLVRAEWGKTLADVGVDPKIDPNSFDDAAFLAFHDRWTERTRKLIRELIPEPETEQQEELAFE